MFSNEKELYNFINSLIKTLETIGEVQWSVDFDHAINISFMPGEVLGAVRATLLKFQKTDIPTRLILEKDVNEAIISLDRALGPNNKAF